VEVCEPPQRLLILTNAPDEPDGVIEATLTADGEQTILVIEDRGLPLEQIAAYGAGDQIHVEDLASYLAGRERCDARVRWQELHPTYQNLAADLT
jgi:anti-sigma regulatory factor (Ser/Thr protein kinase)